MKLILTKVAFISLMLVAAMREASAQTLVDFTTMPSAVTTNIAAFPVTGRISPTTQALYVNNQPIPFDSWSLDYFVVVDLAIGNNPITVRIVAQNGTQTSTTKQVEYSPGLSTAAKPLIYANAQYLVDGNAHDGILAIDPVQGTFLGILKDMRAHGITPDGRELIVTDGARVRTASHTVLAGRLESCCTRGSKILFSADGRYVYYQSHKAELAAGLIEMSYPFDFYAAGMTANKTKIVTSWGDIDLTTDEGTAKSYPELRVFHGDFVIDPTSTYLLGSSFSFASGEVNLYDASSGTFLESFYGGDFAGDIVFSPDGRQAYAGFNGNVYLGGGGIIRIKMQTREWQSIPRIGAIALASAPNGTIYGSAFYSTYSGRIHGDRNVRGIVEYLPDASAGLIISRVFFVNLLSGPTGGGYDKQSIFYKVVSANRCLDASSLARWRSNFGLLTGADWDHGDFDGDGDVDGGDFLYWQRNQSTCPAAQEAEAIPQLLLAPTNPKKVSQPNATRPAAKSAPRRHSKVH